MLLFSNDTEALAFLDRLLKSEFWLKIEELVKEREKSILSEMRRTDIGGNARALLNGRFLELRWIQEFPINALAFAKWQIEQAKLVNQQKGEEQLVSKAAFPDVVTH